MKLVTKENMTRKKKEKYNWKIMRERTTENNDKKQGNEAE